MTTITDFICPTFVFRTQDTEHRAYNGRLCHIIGELESTEADLFETGPMFTVQFLDLHEITVFADELELTSMPYVGSPEFDAHPEDMVVAAQISGGTA